jgi:Uma2 family endonuclease
LGIALKRRRFTVAEYHRMGEAGIFAEDDRVELIAGEVVEMTPIGPRHAATVDRIVHLFISRLGDHATGASTRSRSPARTPSSSPTSIYARDAVREVWLVHLDDMAVEIHRRPQGSRYADNARFSRGQSLTIEAFPDVAFQVDDLIG